MNIGRAAELSGVPSKTIRYYESVGLLPPTGRAANGYRDFTAQDVDILRFISRGRGLGFSVEQVNELLSLYRDRERASMRDALQTLAQQCPGDARPECPILADLMDPVHARGKA